MSGHVVSDEPMPVFTTCEVVLGECQGAEFRREYDNETGFKELVVAPRKT